MPLRARKILLVEDDEISQLVTSSLLKSLGASVSVAATGGMALEMAEPGRYDTIILDLELPDMSGYTIARRIRQHERQTDERPAAILALSAYAGAEEQRLSAEAGMDGTMSKPLDVAMLFNLLRHRDIRHDGKIASDTTNMECDFAWLQRNLGELSLCYETLEDAISVFPRYLSELRSLIASGRNDEAIRLAHRFGGAAASVGAAALSQTLAEVKTNLREHDCVSLVGMENELLKFLLAAKGVMGGTYQSSPS